MNHFQLFDIPVSFLPDEQEIRQRYFSLSRKYHPDFAATLPPAEQLQTLQHATAVNKAYHVLSHFDRRMHYILLEKGVVEEEGKYTLPPDFLMDMMEFSEQAMMLKMDPDPEKINAFKATIAARDQQLLDGIMPVLRAYDASTATDAQYAQIRDFYYKRRYILRIKEQMNNFADPDTKV